MKSNPVTLACQPAFGVEGRHAAGAGGRDRLPGAVGTMRINL